MSETPSGMAEQILAFCEELRSEDVAIGTSEIQDAFRALEIVPWTEPVDFRESLATTLAKSPKDREIFDLVFDRHFFRATEAASLEFATNPATSGPAVSGDPASKHFNDQAERYATGNLREVYFYPEQLQGHTERTYHPGE